MLLLSERSGRRPDTSNLVCFCGNLHDFARIFAISLLLFQKKNSSLLQLAVKLASEILVVKDINYAEKL